MDNRKKVIALGFFDGVHLGHQPLLQKVAERSRQLDMTPAVFTFDRSPREFVTGIPVPLLTTAEERRQRVMDLFAIGDVIIAPFDREMMTMPWEDFVLMLARKYQAGWLVAGHDFRFGHQNTGTPALLAEKAAQLGMGCDIIPAVTLDGITVSSSHIRKLLEQGNVDQAARFLGNPFSIQGSVLHGKGLGSRIGTPTVNLIPPANRLIPARGVYVTRVWVDGQVFPAITNVGVRPTVDTDGGITVESHILGQSLHLYGKDCRVEFLKMLRSEKKFGSLNELQAQIAEDTRQAQEYFRI